MPRFVLILLLLCFILISLKWSTRDEPCPNIFPANRHLHTNYTCVQLNDVLNFMRYCSQKEHSADTFGTCDWCIRSVLGLPLSGRRMYVGGFDIPSVN